MQFSGVPDPMDELRARVQTIAFPVMGPTPQRTGEYHGAFGLSDGHDSNGLSEQSVSISYTLWRNSDDREDPGDLADLDEQTRASLDLETTWNQADLLRKQFTKSRPKTIFVLIRRFGISEHGSLDCEPVLVGA